MSGSPFTITNLEAPTVVTLDNEILEMTSEFKGSEIGGEKSVYNKTTLPLPPFKGVVEEL